MKINVGSVNLFAAILLTVALACSSLAGGTTKSFCNNPYWPLKEGATWTYLDGHGTHTTTFSVSNISSSTADLQFDEKKLLSLLCLDAGIQSSEEDNFSTSAIFMLPNEKDISVGNSWPLAGKKLYKGIFADVREIVSYTVPAGTFETAHICIRAVEEGEQACTFSAYFAKDVGLVYYSGYGSSELMLKEYNIP